ncbi:MAG: hypothetical protein ACOCYX_05135, partial [Spirochaetota bacterium]
ADTAGSDGGVWDLVVDAIPFTPDDAYYLTEGSIGLKRAAKVVLLSAGTAEPDRCVGRILNVAGSDVVESVEYYRIVAEHPGVSLIVNETPVCASPTGAFVTAWASTLHRSSGDGVYSPNACTEHRLHPHRRHGSA